MKKLLLLSGSVLGLVFAGCTPESPVVPDEERKPAIVYVNGDYTFDGVNIKYTYPLSALDVGDVLKVDLSSSNDPAPEVAVLWNDEEVARYEELPATFTKEMDTPGTHQMSVVVSSGGVNYTTGAQVVVSENK